MIVLPGPPDLAPTYFTKHYFLWDNRPPWRIWDPLISNESVLEACPQVGAVQGSLKVFFFFFFLTKGSVESHLVLPLTHAQLTTDLL